MLKMLRSDDRALDRSNRRAAAQPGQRPVPRNPMWRPVRRISQRVGLMAAAVALAGTGCLDSGEDPARVLPNIVIVLADDMGYGDVGVYNAESRIPTPNMDRLAAEGIRFMDMHSADSVCTPSRYGLLTGRYCWRTRLQRSVLFNYEPPLIESDRLTLASLVQRAGYSTGMFGKWHLGLAFKAKDGKQVDFDRPLPWYAGPDPDPEVGGSIDFSTPVSGGPTDLGFDEAFYTAGCSTDQEPFCFIRNGTFLGMETATYRHPAGSWRSGMTAENWVNETVDVRFTREATGFIERTAEAKPNRPLFVYLALSAPHSPHLVPGFATGQSEAGVRGDMVWLVDWAVGKIMATLDARGLSDNTLLIVTSDNGPLRGSLEPGAPERTATVSNGHRSAGELRGFKGRVYEGGHRVPFIARWPGRTPAGTVNEQPMPLVDVMATIAAIIGEELPDDAGEDSFNMLAALEGTAGAAPLRSAIVHHSGGGAFALRDGRWKIVFGREEERVQPLEGTGYLFDLRADLHEARDVWAQNPAIVRRLTETMERFKSAGRSVPRH